MADKYDVIEQRQGQQIGSSGRLVDVMNVTISTHPSSIVFTFPSG